MPKANVAEQLMPKANVQRTNVAEQLMPKANVQRTNVAKQLMPKANVQRTNVAKQQLSSTIASRLSNDYDRTGEFNGLGERRGDDSQSPGVAIYLSIVVISMNVSNPSLFWIFRVKNSITVPIMNAKLVSNFIQIKTR